MAVHPGAAAVEQDRPAVMVADRPVDSPAHRWRQRDQDDIPRSVTAREPRGGAHARRVSVPGGRR